MPAKQETLDLKGRAPDPMLEDAIAHPHRIVEFIFHEHPGYLKGELVKDGQPTGVFFALSKVQLQGSRRVER